MRLLSVLLGVGLVIGLMVFVMDKVNDEGTKTNHDVAVKVLPGGVVVPAAGPGRGPAAAGRSTRRRPSPARAPRARCGPPRTSTRRSTGSSPTCRPSSPPGPIRQPSQDLYVIASTDGYATFKLVGKTGCP